MTVKIHRTSRWTSIVERRFNVFSLNHSTKPIILKGRLEIVLSRNTVIFYKVKSFNDDSYRMRRGQISISLQVKNYLLVMLRQGENSWENMNSKNPFFLLKNKLSLEVKSLQEGWTHQVTFIKLILAYGNQKSHAGLRVVHLV